MEEETKFNPNHKNPNNKDLYFLLGEINGKLDGLVNNQNKTIYALIALSGATIGLKLMGTPPMAVISRFINMFVFLFIFIVGFSLRKRLYGWYFIFLYGFLGVVANLISLVGGESLTTNFRVPVFILANLSMLIFVWKWDKWHNKLK